MGEKREGSRLAGYLAFFVRLSKLYPKAISGSVLSPASVGVGMSATNEAVISFLSCVVLLGYIQDGRREPSCSVGRGNFVSVITYKMR